MLKKAQTAIGIMPLIAIALSAAVLIAIHSFSNGLTSQSAPLANIVEELQFNHDYVLKQAELIAKQTINQCSSCSDKQLKEKFQEIALEKERLFKFEGIGNFYGKIRNGKFEISDKIIVVSGLFVESGFGYNKIKRNFDIKISLEQHL
ncbi:hypothetical protein J4462_04775 [Candidatus Pacearchaeota archaeon]|nr:hypothetical protein [Candidatus Pacearchaeota archaeon]